MSPQLEQIEREFLSAQERLRALAREVPLSVWPVRPEPNRWSIADCVEHLNRTAEGYLPVLRDALRRIEHLRRPARRYHRDPMGWLITVTLPPPVRFRFRTTAPFQPAATADAEELMRTFERLQEEQIRCLREADGLPLSDLRILSPIDSRRRYNVYSAFVMLPRHQHRHLWQAERVAQRLGAPTSQA